MITHEQLTTFASQVQEKVRTLDDRAGYNKDERAKALFEVMPGKSYARIVQTNGHGNTRSAFCFVRMEDGAIMKSAGWKAPAKHARGNIANGAADVGQYGPAYMR